MGGIIVFFRACSSSALKSAESSPSGPRSTTTITARRKEPLDQSIGAGRDILLDIDVQGARQIKQAYPQAVSIFLLPPSLRELKRRLAARGTDGKEIIRRRLANARGEIREIIHYDYYVVNREVKRGGAGLELHRRGRAGKNLSGH